MNVVKRGNDGIHYRGYVLDGDLGADIKVGSLSALLTVVKTSVVAAINEIVGLIDSIHDELDDVWTYFLNFYTKVNLRTSGQAEVHWDNITNRPNGNSLLEATAPAQILYSLDGSTFQPAHLVYDESTLELLFDENAKSLVVIV